MLGVVVPGPCRQQGSKLGEFSVITIRRLRADDSKARPQAAMQVFEVCLAAARLFDELDTERPRTAALAFLGLRT